MRGYRAQARSSFTMLRRLVLFWLVLLASATAHPELELPRKVQIWLDTRPAEVQVYQLRADSGPAEWLGTSQQRLTLELEPAAKGVSE